MVKEPRTVSVERDFDASPEAVFDAWIDPARAAQWLFRTEGGVLERCEIDGRVGGLFRINERRGKDLAEHHGKFVAIDRPNRLAFDFWTSFSDKRTRVTVAIERQGSGSRVTLAHEGVLPDYIVQTRWGWTTLLERLGRTV